MTKAKTTKIDMRPVSSFAGELVTLLEFIRVAKTHYPKATDSILTDMDLSDEAFLEEITTLGNAIGFDFDDDGTDEETTDGPTTEGRDSNPV